MNDAKAAADYRHTIFLPKTDFPMKAGLAQTEPRLLQKWRDADAYGQLRAARKGAPRYILHDGPPYANGDMHLGHAMNHILKDFVVRTRNMLGYDAPYIPGWDCHGLPIEWRVEEQNRAEGRKKEEVDFLAFRQQCRDYATHWVGVQREQIQRLGMWGEWDNPYLTMNFSSEATIASELMKFAETGQLYRGAKPVMWSPVEQTALAEAEVEYEDVTSTQVDVAFEIVEAPNCPELVGAYAVIWTTTPWTLPVNRALAYGEEISYQIGEVNGHKYLVANELLDSVAARAGWSVKRVSPISGTSLAGAIVRHPWHEKGGFFAEPRPLLPGDFVTTDAGTGLVHMAPDHGEDDFLLCKAHGIEPKFVVGPDGVYQADWPVVGGQHVYKVNAPDGPVCTALAESGALLAAAADYRHSYPHSWRSKAKLIYRCTPQWFVAMDRDLGDGTTLRGRALAGIAATRWFPAQGENRIRAMVEGRPDWVLSRQRAWGVPLTLFVKKGTGDYLQDPAVNARIRAAFTEEGADAWWMRDPQYFLGHEYDAADYEQVTDILDVWFDSGSTHAFVTEARLGAKQADLYLEGSDQHRGWFQSSLLESCGTRGRPPYKAVLTHGFTLDERGRKMSKSLGNVVDPLKLIGESGADVLRLWAGGVDFTEDVRLGKAMLQTSIDSYRKLRNTLRYLLGALAGYTEAEALPPADMPELERYILSRLSALDAELRAFVERHAYNQYTAAISAFVNQDLSAFFFDIRKDSLYCDRSDAPTRRAYRTTLAILFDALVKYLSPVLVFTSEEAWEHRYGDGTSVHHQVWADAPRRDTALEAKFSRLRELRSLVTQEIEPLRRNKEIGSSSEAHVDLSLKDDAEDFDTEAFSALCLVASVQVSSGDADAASVRISADPRCERCWRHLPDVAAETQLCGRCAEAIA
ncbi:MAG: isoleucine--tRNA ligase [Sphingomonadaceae bacterium]